MAQDAMWKLGETIGDREGRMDVCVAAAGILKGDHDCLSYPAKRFQEVRRRALLPYQSLLLTRSSRA